MVPGALTYDISMKHNFVMRAALMWTINDFPAYGMVSGWSTHGKLACLYCMENNKAFTGCKTKSKLRVREKHTTTSLQVAYESAFSRWTCLEHIKAG